MSYDATILADSPVAYWKLDEISGNQAADSSGNDYHATIPSVEENLVPIVYGIGGPIETDSPNVGMSGGVARAPVASALDTTGNCSWEIWAYTGDPSANTAILLTRASAAGGNGGSHIRINGQTITGDLRINGSSWIVSFGNQLPWQTWFHIVVTRNGTVLRLYLNGYLKDERADLPPTDPITFARSNWGISALPGLSGFNTAGSWGVARAAIYDTVLSPTRVLVHYEAARRRQPMFATINLRTTFIPNLTPPPTFEGYQLKHNWATPVIERLSRVTGVQVVKDGTEERTGRTTRTRRKYSYNSWITDELTRRQFSAFMRSNLRKPVVLPILTNTTRLTVAAVATDTVLNVSDTAFRAFDVGSRVMIATSDSEFEIGEVEAKTATTITLVDPLENSWRKGARVSPAKLSYLEQEIRPVIHTRDVQNIPVTASVLVEEIPASPNDVTLFTPGYTYRSTEVFDPFQWGLNDAGESIENSIAQISELMDADIGLFAFDSDVTVSHDGIGYSLLLEGLEQIALFRGWYEARAGRLNPLWVPTMVTDLGTYVSRNFQTITVSQANYEADYNLDEHRRDIAFIKRDRTLSFARINTVAQVGDNEELVLDAASPQIADTRFICFLRFCRLDADEIEFAWLTSEVVRVTLRFREVLNEIP